MAKEKKRKGKELNNKEMEGYKKEKSPSKTDLMNLINFTNFIN